MQPLRKSPDRQQGKTDKNIFLSHCVQRHGRISLHELRQTYLGRGIKKLRRKNSGVPLRPAGAECGGRCPGPLLRPDHSAGVLPHGRKDASRHADRYHPVRCFPEEEINRARNNGNGARLYIKPEQGSFEDLLRAFHFLLAFSF